MNYVDEYTPYTDEDFSNAVLANGRNQVIKYLKGGYDVNSFAQDKFWEAIFSGYKQDIVVEILLYGYNRFNLTNDTFLYLIHSNQERILQVLIEMRCQLDNFPKEGFLYLVSKGRGFIVFLLLEKGYKIDTFIGEVFSTTVLNGWHSILLILIENNYHVDNCDGETFVNALLKIKSGDIRLCTTIELLLKYQYPAVLKVTEYFSSGFISLKESERSLLDYVDHLVENNHI